MEVWQRISNGGEARGDLSSWGKVQKREGYVYKNDGSSIICNVDEDSMK